MNVSEDEDAALVFHVVQGTVVEKSQVACGIQQSEGVDEVTDGVVSREMATMGRAQEWRVLAPFED